MEDTFYYINTDLDLTSAGDLSALATAFETWGAFLLHLTRGEDGLWYATFEVSYRDKEPEPAITAMLAIVDSLGESFAPLGFIVHRGSSTSGTSVGANRGRSIKGCPANSLGGSPTGASLRITLYPPEWKTTTRVGKRCCRLTFLVNYIRPISLFWRRSSLILPHQHYRQSGQHRARQ